MSRIISYAEAICEASAQEMERDERVVIIGQGVDDYKGFVGTTSGLAEKFGPDRVMDTPVAEDGMTGVAIGMALAGLRPIHTHIRMDFMLLAVNQLLNIAAKSRYMSGGAVQVPLTVRTVIGRSWGQGAQHSQGLRQRGAARIAGDAWPAAVYGAHATVSAGRVCVWRGTEPAAVDGIWFDLAGVVALLG